MGKYRIHQKDGNEDAIVAVLRAHGASVEPGNGTIDKIIGIAGVTALAEIKTPKGKLRTSQVQFFASFRGLARVIRSEQDAVALLQDMQQQANGTRC